ncbi:hypothetical protein DBIPINDM_006141 [Mesorhizobium sp. AR02]|uniref:hypothetical protein n=1 Tax=Mesorhizobium sp. AR02 TaxID=2865837 RepID=UPI00215E569E|nr:hypothetical protein [Mesorhizobium sp. AR02]UVK52733.1 hypothetical protein DBIPINDM_006141 [Mesorhizobium sp. AR02]
MAQVRVKLKARRQINIHNDLGGAAFYFKKKVDHRIETDDREGISFEIMAGLTFLAFEAEAKFNFLGYKLIKGWNEREQASKKVEAVCGALGVKPDHAARPYSSLSRLRTFRNTLAHGKPDEHTFDQEVVATVEELEAMGILHAEWESHIDQTFLSEAYDDLDQIWKDLLEKSGLTIFDTLTHGSSHMSFIEHV